MPVVATAGHVDHGKSTLVRALTGTEPDRWAEERRRGLTIDLGFAWTTLPSGRDVAFVDVPGHERFLANMLAGLGPAPVVCFVVAADEGWRAQSSDHRDAVAALGIEHGLIVVTRADLAPDRVDAVVAEARTELAGTGLRDAPAVAVSAVDGRGLDDLRGRLDEVLAAQPEPARAARVRLWVDRAFTIDGAGTVVTGTLAAGTITPGDRLQLLGRGPDRVVTVRGVQARGQDRSELTPVERAAVNLRGIAADAVARGDALVTPDAWFATAVVDVRRRTGRGYDEVGPSVTVHAGTAAVPAHLRPFGPDHARVSLNQALPLAVGDVLVLRFPDRDKPFGGATVLDVEPPTLSRRGDGARRAKVLAATPPGGDPLAEVARRGAVRPEHLRRLGFDVEAAPAGVRVLDGWWVDPDAFAGWVARLGAGVDAVHAQDPLAPGWSEGAAQDGLALPSSELLEAVVAAAGLERAGGFLRRPGRTDVLGTAAEAIATLEARLAAEPFDAPEAEELVALGLGPAQLAAAARAGRILRLPGGVVLRPDAPEAAVAALAGLDQPFTTSQARQRLGTTRRVVIPLLEHLDGLGRTRRLDAGHRELTGR